MGIYKRSNGVYYVQLNIDGKIIQKSLKTKNHILAKDLYHVILREHLLKNWLERTLVFEPKTSLSSIPTEKQLNTTKIKQTPNFEKWYFKYLESCKTQNISKLLLSKKKDS